MRSIRVESAPLAIRGVFIAVATSVIVLVFVVSKLAVAGVRYFPPAYAEPSVACDYGSQTRKRPIVNDIELDWYSAQWRAAEEPSLYLASQDPAAVHALTYRFTWLPTFHHPVMVRIDTMKDGRMRLTAKQLSGAGGYEPGAVAKQVVRTLTPGEQARLKAALGATGVLTLPPTACGLGADGSQWIVEANDHGRYTFVNRWTPPDGPVHAFGLLMLSFTGWHFQPVY